MEAAIGVITWSLERQKEGPARRDQPAELISTVGVDGDPSAIPNALVMDSGRWLRSTGEIVIGSKLSRDKGLGVDDSIRLSSRDFTIVGIGRIRGTGSGFGSDSLAYLERQSLRQRADLGDVVNLIMIRTAQSGAVRERVQQIGSFSTPDRAELVNEATTANASGIALDYILIGLTLLIAGLFVSNMLLRAVGERRLEFATLRALGLPSRTILLTIAAQAVLISAVAGIVGVGIATVFDWAINVTIAAQYGLKSLYSADAGLFTGVFVIALVLGLGSGLYPARQATRVDPAIVLREA